MKVGRISFGNNILADPRAVGRRDMLKTSTVAGLGIVGGAAFSAPACDKKNLSGWITTIVASYGELKPLLPQLGLSQTAIDRVSGWIDTAESVARKFDEAYKAGQFTDAAALFTNLGGLITSIAAELNVANNRIVNLLLVGIQIARITIASLLKVQGDSRRIMPVTTAEMAAIVEIRRLAAIDVSGLLKAIQ